MSQEAGKITLKRTSTGWSAKFEGDAAATVLSAFGVDTIPTAFTSEAPAANVQKEIRHMWPKCYVTIEGGEMTREERIERALTAIVYRGYCPSCGSERANTEGCTWCECILEARRALNILYIDPAEVK